MKLDEGTSGLDPTTRLRAADLPRLLAHSGPECDKAVLPCAPSLRGPQLALVEALCAFCRASVESVGLLCSTSCFGKHVEPLL